MFALTRLVFTVALFLGLSMAIAAPEVLGAGPTAAPTQSQPRAVQEDQAPQTGLTRKGAAPVLKLSKDTAKNLIKMKDTERIQVGNKEMSVKEYKIMREADQKKGVAKVKAMRGGTSIKVEALQAEFDKQEEARLSAANAKVMAEMGKIGKVGATPAAPTNGNGAREAIKKEAAEIQAREKAGNATPEDEARADELFNQYQQLK